MGEGEAVAEAAALHGRSNQMETDLGQIILRIAGDEVIIEGTECDNQTGTEMVEVRCKAR